MVKEYLDVVDDKDKVLYKDTRENIWKNGLEHNVRVANIFIFNLEGKLLLPKRSMNRKLFPGTYDFSCGEHVASGETYDNAATRGLKEELKIIGKKPGKLGKITPKEGVNCFMTIYKLIYDQEISDYDKEGIDSLEWVGVEEVKERIKNNPKNFKRDFAEVFEWYLKNFN